MDSPQPQPAGDVAAASVARPGYLAELDGLRALAIALVMAFHLWDYRGANAVGRAANVIARQGWVGVDVFFALSGFLITRILLASRESPHYYGSFYVRRALRIFPLYYAVLGVLLAVGLLAASRGIGLGDLTPHQLSYIWINALYLSNFALAFLRSNVIPLDISWSLAVEEQFYLVYPWVVRRLSRTALERWLVVAIVVAVPLRWISFRWFPGNHYGPYVLPYCRMDALAVGCLAALVLQRQDGTAARWMAKAALPLWLLAAAVAFTWHRGQLTFVLLGYALTAAATAGTIVRLQLGEWTGVARVLRARALVAVGKVSYGLYLLHLLVRVAIDRLPWFGVEQRQSLLLAVVRVVVIAGVSLGAAWCSWLLFEKPILGLKDRLDPAAARRRAPAPPSTT